MEPTNIFSSSPSLHRDDDDYVPDLPTAPSLATSSSSAAGVGGDEDEDATLKELRATSSSSSTSSAPTSSSAPKASSSSSSNSGSKGGKSKSSHSSKKDNSEGVEGGVCATCGRSGSEGVSSDHIPLLDPVAEKKRLEALMIKSEVAAAQALMGLTSTSSGAGAGAGAAVHTPDMKSQVDAVSLLTSDSFRDFGKLVAQRVNEASGASKGGGALATRFFNELLLSGADKLGTHELAALAKVLDTIRNKKLQEERDKSKGASKSKKAAKVQVGGERHGVPMDDYDDDGDYGDYGTTAAGGGGGGASTSGNSGNVGMSLALAGLTVTPGVGSGGGGEGDGKFVRTKFNAEDDFM